LAALIEELLFLRQNILNLTRLIRQLAQQPPYHQHVINLISIPGISALGAMTLLTEIVDVSRFETLDNLAGYAGLVPDENSTGEQQTITGLTKRRNPAIRRILIETSWIAVRRDPALTQAFNQLTRRMTKQKAIIRIARKLLNRIRFVLKNQTAYKTLTV
jgi:transposase